MRNINRLTILTLILLAFISTTTTSFASSIKDRMITRLPTIKALKVSGAVGEDNKGLLYIRDKNHPDIAVVQAENADRQKVYSIIAKKQGTSPAFVGMRRASQISAKAKVGEWLQDKAGNWHQK